MIKSNVLPDVQRDVILVTSSRTVWLGAIAGVMVFSACASTQFDRAIDAQRWSDAASAFDADTALQHDESALFRAAMLYTFPNRTPYNPARARTLFHQFLDLYPNSSKRQEAIDHLALLDDLQRTQTENEQRTHELQAKIARLAADTIALRARLDSIAVRLNAEQDQTALLRKVTTRLENDLQDRETQLRALNDELTHLKEIDLKPSKAKINDKSDNVKKIPVR